MENWLISNLENIGKNVDTAALIQIGVTVVFAVAAYIVLAVIGGKMKRKFVADDEIRKKHIYTTIFRIAKIAVIVVALVIILQSLGFNMSIFVVIIGVVGIVGFFAVKDSFQDIFNGFILMSDKYFSVGDAVRYKGRDGIVTYFTVRTTKIEYLDDRSVDSIANRNISEISKLTHLVDIDLPLSYELDRKTAYAVLTDICKQIAAVEGIESCELKGTQQFADSAIIYKIRFFCEPNNRPDLKREAHRLIQDGLSENGISIPYNQLDVHTK